MTFPAINLDIHAALDLNGDGTYEEDITSYVMVRNSSGRVRIQRGAQAEGSDTEPDQLELVLDNRDGRFSPRNPNGAYYGSIGRNTDIQLWVEEGDRYLKIYGSGDRITTPDAAVLDVTGDIDVRVDISFEGQAPQSQELIGKRAGAGQISWYMLRNTSGSISFAWTEDGTNLKFYDGTVAFPWPSNKRVALRATLDVNNGSGGYTVTYYWAPTIDDDWIQFDQEITTSATTSIFSSTAALEIGDLTDSISNPPVGRIHAAEVYSGIDGTLVANPDLRIQTAGASSFADTTSSPRTWTVVDDAEIDNKKIRFTGQVSEWPVEWDTSGNDIYTSITANGILRQLDTGRRPLESNLVRSIPTDTSCTAYWPMEETQGATKFGSALPGGTPLSFTLFDLAQDDGCFGSKPLPTMRNTANIWGRAGASAVPAAEGEFHGECIFKLDTLPATEATIIQFRGSGTIAVWALRIKDGFANILGSDQDGTLTVNQDIALTSSDVEGKFCRYQIFGEQSGGNVNWTTRIVVVDEGDAVDFSSSYAGTAGRLVAVSGGQPYYGTGTEGMTLGHIAIFDLADRTAFNNADHGYNGETTNSRFIRLASEEGFEFEVIDWDVDNLSEALGHQRPDSLLNILREAELTDGGVLLGARDFKRIKYRDRGSLTNQPIWQSFDYETDIMPGLLPIDDDRYLRNDVTIVPEFGSTARYEVTDGRLSTQSAPDGVGPYPAQFNINNYDEDRSIHHASWRAHLGTVDEARFPQITFNLARNPELINALTWLDVGDRFTVTNVPAKLMYNDLDLIIVGYEEMIHQRDWTITFTCRPYAPFAVAILDDDTLGRLDTTASETVASITSSATSVDVYASDGPTWTRDDSEDGFDANIGGERVTVTQISGTAEDDFSDTQSDTWGSADVGGSWTNTGGSATDFDKTSGRGTHTLTSTNVARISTLAASLADCDMIVDIQSSALATGSFQAGALVARYTDANNLYMARLAFNTDQTITLTLRKRVASVETELDTFILGPVHAANTDIRLRFKIDGSSLYAMAWNPSSVVVPLAWQVEATDTAITAAGGVGVRSILNTGNTNTNPLIRYDNFVVTNPTRWTITRSVNGVVKAPSAGTDVRLWQPAIISL